MIGHTVSFLVALSGSVILQILAFDHSTFEPTAGCTVCNSTLHFSNPAAKKYEVGNQIPFLPFKMKTTWAGNIPIADQATVKNASLYFWMMGKDGPTSGDDLLFWLNGGPGCASTTAAITENGPFFFQEYGQGQTRPNPYSWTKAASIVYVNFPYGVAFTTGKGNNVDQEQISQQFLSFLQNFYKTFPELQSKNVWLVGESVAGKYIPYILDAIRKSNGAIKKPKGVMLIDPLISEKGMISDIATYPFSVENQKDLNLTQSDLDQIKEEAEPCGMIDYVKQNLFYPPKGKLPDFDHSCAPSRVMHQIEYGKNETFNVYNFRKPDLSDYAPPSFMSPNMFYSSPKVQQYIHAPPTEEYVHCKKVFGTAFGPKTDTSLPVDRQPDFQHSILAQAIEESEKFTIIHGDLDALYLTQGTELALQNLTWSNQQGFKSAPTLSVYNMEGKVGGSYTKERGLLYANIPKAGHKVPRDDPSTGLAAIMDLLGQKDWTKP